jgi:lysyl-tRNA synthetase class II
VIFHDYYSDVPRAEIDRFVQTQEMARLITMGGLAEEVCGSRKIVYDGTPVDLTGPWPRLSMQDLIIMSYALVAWWIANRLTRERVVATR